MNASVGILVIPWTATMHQLHDIHLKQANAVVAINKSSNSQDIVNGMRELESNENVIDTNHYL